MGLLGGIIGSMAKSVAAAVSGGNKATSYSSNYGGSSDRNSSDAYRQWRNSNPNYYVSSQDDRLARTNPDAADSIMRNKTAYYDAYSSGNKEAMMAANAALNADRARLGGYNAGGSGMDYNTPGKPAEYTVTSPYTNVNVEETRRLQQNNDEARQLYDAMVRQGTDRLNAQRGTVNSAYDTSATNSYINYMQGQRMLPEQLAAAGITGGATESSLIDARAGYENNLYLANEARNKALQEIDTAVVELQNSGDVQSAQYILSNADKIADNYAKAAYADIARKDSLAEQAKQNAYQEAALTGLYQGAPTFEAQQINYNKALAQAMETGDFSIMGEYGWTDAGIRTASQNWRKQRGW